MAVIGKIMSINFFVFDGSTMLLKYSSTFVGLISKAILLLLSITRNNKCGEIISTDRDYFCNLKWVKTQFHQIMF